MTSQRESKAVMKFSKRYREYVESQNQQFPAVELKKLKNILQNCSAKDLLPRERDGAFCDCPQNCSVCDGTFFSSLLKDMSEVLNYFNKRAEKFLESHLDNGWSKCFAFMKEKVQGNHANLIQEGKDLLSYAIMNAEAIQKILKKYDKVHCSMKGQRFRSEAQSMHLEVLRSPFLYELMAFNINMREDKLESKRTTPKWFEDCSLHIGDGKPSLSINLSSSINFSADLTCSICLETVFDPVSLLCGHIYCYMCACSAASVTTIEGLKAANSKSRCPLCREDGVFEGAVHMDELSILLSRSLSEYWKERKKKERQARIQEAKEYWESHSRSFMGM